MPNCNHYVVPEAWIRGEHMSRGNLWTDGTNLYSYRLVIGVTDASGRKIALDYTAPNHFHSMTTSKHVGGARRVAHRTVSPLCSIGSDPARYRLRVDTAGSTEGPFPAVDPDAFEVQFFGPFGWETALVSGRYTGPVDAADAAVTAVTALREVLGFDVPLGCGFAQKSWHVTTRPVSRYPEWQHDQGLVSWDNDTEEYGYHECAE